MVSRRLVGLQLLVLALALALVAAACGGARVPSSAPPTATATLPPAPKPRPTAAPSPTVPCITSPPPSSGTAKANDYLKPYDHVRGHPERAAVVLVVYSDFQCTMCARLAQNLTRIWQAHPKDVALVYRHFPLLNLHDKAALAAQASEAAARQGKFWEMHDLLFAQQSQWVGMDGKDFLEYLRASAKRLGLNVQQFNKDLTSPEVVGFVRGAWQNAISHNLPSVPLLYINGRVYDGPMDFSDLDTVIRLQILARRQFHTCPPLLSEGERPSYAVLHTTRGEIEIALFPEQAPDAVSSFVFLVRHGWYNNNPILVDGKGRWVRSGDPSGTGLGNAGYTFGTEAIARLKFDRAGRVALYNSGGYTNSSQFFITLRPLPSLDGHFTIFGQVVKGEDVVRSLTPHDRLLRIILKRH